GAHTVFESHAHAAYTVSVVQAGTIELSVGETPYRVRVGEAVLLNVGEVHAARATDYMFVSIGLAPELIDALLVESGLAFSDAHAGFRAPTAHDPALASLAEKMRGEMAEARPGQGPMLDALA